MPQILLPQRFLAQPQYPATLDKGHWFGSKATLAITGALPDFNAGTGKLLSITGGGSGFSRRVTQQGVSLYTPNGGWANIGINQDWAGPNTIIALCRVNGIDNPWGGLFSKDSSGTSTQFGIGRNNFNDSLYGSVDDSTAVSFGGSSIPSLADFSVIAFTHSGVTSASMSYYRNGVLVGTTSALAAQPSGSGVLGLGRSRDSSASYDSDVDWIAFLRAPIVASAAQIRELSDNIWAAWKAPSRRIWVAATSPDVTVALSGQASASSQGSLGVDTSVALSGQQVASSAGTLTPGVGVVVALAGQSSSFAQGSLSPATGIALSGQALAFSQGTIGVAGDVTVALTGIAITASQGTLSPPAPSSGGFSGPLSFGKVRSRKYRDKDRDEIRKSLLEQLEEKVEELREDVSPPEVPQAIKTQAAQIVEEYREPSIDLQAMERDIQKVRALLKSYEEEVRRRRDEEDEELLFMFL